MGEEREEEEECIYRGGEEGISKLCTRSYDALADSQASIQSLYTSTGSDRSEKKWENRHPSCCEVVYLVHATHSLFAFESPPGTRGT